MAIRSKLAWGLVLILLVTAIVQIIRWGFDPVDDCLDRGERWDYEAERCEGLSRTSAAQ